MGKICSWCRPTLHRGLRRATLSSVIPDDPYARAFAALASGDVLDLAAALEDARSHGERAGLVVATLLCRADLSPHRVEVIGVRSRCEVMALAWREAALPVGVRPAPSESARRVELGLLHDYTALVLRACGPTWPVGVAPVVVAWALMKVVTVDLRHACAESRRVEL